MASATTQAKPLPVPPTTGASAAERSTPPRRGSKTTSEADGTVRTSGSAGSMDGSGDGAADNELAAAAVPLTDTEKKKRRKEEKKKKKLKKKQAWAATVDEEEYGWNYDGAGVVTPDMFVLRPVRSLRPAANGDEDAGSSSDEDSAAHMPEQVLHVSLNGGMGGAAQAAAAARAPSPKVPTAQPAAQASATSGQDTAKALLQAELEAAEAKVALLQASLGSSKPPSSTSGAPKKASGAAANRPAALHIEQGPAKPKAIMPPPGIAPPPGMSPSPKASSVPVPTKLASSNSSMAASQSVPAASSGRMKSFLQSRGNAPPQPHTRSTIATVRSQQGASGRPSQGGASGGPTLRVSSTGAYRLHAEDGSPVPASATLAHPQGTDLALSPSGGGRTRPWSTRRHPGGAASGGVSYAGEADRPYAVASSRQLARDDKRAVRSQLVADRSPRGRFGSPHLHAHGIPVYSLPVDSSAVTPPAGASAGPMSTKSAYFKPEHQRPPPFVQHEPPPPLPVLIHEPRTNPQHAMVERCQSTAPGSVISMRVQRVGADEEQHAESKTPSTHSSQAPKRKMSVRLAPEPPKEEPSRELSSDLSEQQPSQTDQPLALRPARQATWSTQVVAPPADRHSSERVDEQQLQPRNRAWSTQVQPSRRGSIPEFAAGAPPPSPEHSPEREYRRLGQIDTTGTVSRQQRQQYPEPVSSGAVTASAPAESPSFQERHQSSSVHQWQESGHLQAQTSHSPAFRRSPEQRLVSRQARRDAVADFAFEAAERTWRPLNGRHPSEPYYGAPARGYEHPPQQLAAPASPATFPPPPPHSYTPPPHQGRAGRHEDRQSSQGSPAIAARRSMYSAAASAAAGHRATDVFGAASGQPWGEVGVPSASRSAAAAAAAAAAQAAAATVIAKAMPETITYTPVGGSPPSSVYSAQGRRGNQPSWGGHGGGYGGFGQHTAPSSVLTFTEPEISTAHLGRDAPRHSDRSPPSSVRVPAKPHRSAHIRGLNRALRMEEGKASDEQGALLTEVGNRHAVEDAQTLRSAYGYPF